MFIFFYNMHFSARKSGLHDEFKSAWLGQKGSLDYGHIRNEMTKISSGKLNWCK